MRTARVRREKGCQAIGRSRGGLTSKLHAPVADERTPLGIGLSPDQTGDSPCGRELLRRPALVMDRAYQGDDTRRLVLELGYQPVVPPRANRAQPWDCDRDLYR